MMSIKEARATRIELNIPQNTIREELGLPRGKKLSWYENERKKIDKCTLACYSAYLYDVMTGKREYQPSKQIISRQFCKSMFVGRPNVEIFPLVSKRIQLEISYHKIARYLEINPELLVDFEKGMRYAPQSVIDAYSRFLDNVEARKEYEETLSNRKNVNKQHKQDYPRTKEGWLIVGSFN